MSNTEKIKEVVIYIHGVSSNKEDQSKKDQSKEDQSHEAEYKEFHEGMKKELKIRHVVEKWPTCRIDIEWGHHCRKEGEKAEGHELLTKAQKYLGDRTIKITDKAENCADSIDPCLPVGKWLRSMRDLMIYSFSDMFYYVSDDGKKSVLNAVANQIKEGLSSRFSCNETENNEPHISLTIVGHSAGSVIASDLLFCLFSTSKHNFFNDSLCTLYDWAQTNKLRIRCLISLGSPLTALAIRSDAILDILSDGARLKPQNYGLNNNFQNGDKHKLNGARWINIWYTDDVIAYPVEPLVESKIGQKTIVKDFYLRSDKEDPFGVHDSYWSHQGVYNRIAKAWSTPN